jgi:hypothetical protein
MTYNDILTLEPRISAIIGGLRPSGGQWALKGYQAHKAREGDKHDNLPPLQAFYSD